MPSRTIAIGDIHGHSIALKALIAAIKPQPSDTIVFLGDFIDRGPDSAAVIQQVIDLSSLCKTVTLMGNHEEMMLKACNDPSRLQIWLSNGGDTALRSYGESMEISNIPHVHRNFLTRLVRYHETDSHFFIHANYAPNWKLEQHDSNTALWLPLTDLPGRHYSGKTAVVGHAPQPNGKALDLGYLICLDTGCGLGGYLTAMDIESKQSWQVDERGCIHR